MNFVGQLIVLAISTMYSSVVSKMMFKRVGGLVSCEKIGKGLIRINLWVAATGFQTCFQTCLGNSLGKREVTRAP